MLRSLAFLGVFLTAQDPAAPLEDPEDVVLRLSADDPGEREAASSTLRRIGPRAIPALEAVARGDDPERRARARSLLRELDATSALVEDLASDDVPGNAKAARVKLIRRYDPSVRDALAAVLKSADTQQVVEAAFILIDRGDAAVVLKSAPDVHTRAAAAWMRGETGGFAWLACQVALSLDAELDPRARQASWRRSLAGIAPHALTNLVRDAWKLARDLKRPFPAPLLRHYLLNLRHDDQWMNAYWTEPFVRSLGEAAVPALREMLDDHDLQARTTGAQLLLQLRPADDLPPRSWADLLPHREEAASKLAALGEEAVPALLETLDSEDRDAALRAARLLLQRDRAKHLRAAGDALADIALHHRGRRLRPEAVRLLADLGADAAPTLVRLARDRDGKIALLAASGLAAADPARHAPSLAPLAIANLATDGFEGNAALAVDVLVTLGAHAEEPLRRALESEDEQTVAGAAAALARGRRLGTPGERARAQLRRVAARGIDPDEGDDLLRILEAARR